MLGQPVYFLTPDVVGFELTGRLREGCTATDLVLTVTEILRKRQGGGQVRRVLRRGHAHAWRCPTAPPSPTWRPSTARRWASSRSTRRTVEYFEGTGRTEPTRSRPSRPTSRRRACSACRARARSTTRTVVTLDLGTVTPSLAGPKRPQDRIEIRRQFRCQQAEPTASTSRPMLHAHHGRRAPSNGFNQPIAPPKLEGTSHARTAARTARSGHASATATC